MKKTTVNLLLILVIACILAFFLAKPGLFVNLKELSIPDLIFLLALGGFSLFPLAYQFRYLVLVFNVILPFREWFGLTVANAMYNYLSPARGGMVARAFFLKRKYNFPLTEYGALLMGLFWFSFLVSSLLALILGILCYSPENKMSALIIVASISILVGTIAIGVAGLWFDLSKIPIPITRLRTILGTFSRGLKKFQTNKRLIPPITGFSLALIFVYALRLYWTYRALGIPLDFEKVLLLQAFINISAVISLTPGNFGIHEGIAGALAGYLGMSPDQALLGVLVDRAITIIVVFIVGFIYSRILLHSLGGAKPPPNGAQVK